MGFFDWVGSLFSSEKPEKTDANEGNIGRDVGKGLKGMQDMYGTGGALDQAFNDMKDQDNREAEARAEDKAAAAKAKADAKLP